MKGLGITIVSSIAGIILISEAIYIARPNNSVEESRKACVTNAEKLMASGIRPDSNDFQWQIIYGQSAMGLDKIKSGEEPTDNTEVKACLQNTRCYDACLTTTALLRYRYVKYGL